MLSRLTKQLLNILNSLLFMVRSKRVSKQWLVENRTVHAYNLYPELVCNQNPEWLMQHKEFSDKYKYETMFRYNPGYMISHRPSWVFKHRPHQLFYFNVDYLVQHEVLFLVTEYPMWTLHNHPKIMMKYRRDWVKTNFPHLEVKDDK